MFTTTIATAADLRNEFESCNRDDYSMVTYEGLIDFSDDIGGMELDVIAICCDLNEMALKDVINSYDLDEETTFESAVEYISEHTMVIAADEHEDIISFFAF